ncbi:MAG: SusC/RagA family TonB-linked outer membrane protein [Cyclobacteriaceae bacterium]
MNVPLLKKKISLETSLVKRLTALAMFCFVVCVSHAQTTVSGRITSDEDASPIPGVNILLKGTALGTISDADGKYNLTVPESDAILVFSFVGYLTQEVPLGGKSTLDVVLPTDAKQLTEVIVTALGIEKDKSQLGYSVQEVKGEDLVKARDPNPINNLAGKIAGLTIGGSPELLGQPSLLLRGRSPLFVVDGVPIQSDTWNISPDDIESYTVLKGPAASALYGSRGQNGAIQITTKRGTKDNRGFSVEFNSSNTVENGFLAIPKVQDEYGPGDHGRYAFGDGRGAGLYDSDYDIWGPKFEGQLIPQYDGEVDPNNSYTTTFPSGATFTGNVKPTPWRARGKDNLTRFLRPGVLTTNNIAVSSVGEHHDVRFSTTYSYQQGIVPNTQLSSNNFNFTAGIDLSPKVRFESSINYNNQYTDNVPDVAYGPNSLIYNMILWGGADWDVDDMKDYWQEGKEGIQQIYADYTRYNNPWFMAKEWLRGHNKKDLYGSMSLTWEIADGLELAGRTQINSYDLFRTEKFPYSATSYGREQAKGDYREDTRRLFENNTDIMLTFSKEVTTDFTVKASVGGNIRTFNYTSNYAMTDYLNVPGWYNFANSLNPVRSYNFSAPMQVLSTFGYADFSYRNFLNLSVTGRIDKHSTLPTKNNSYFYPSVSLSTILSEVIELPAALSYLKLRGSYANVGSALTSATVGPIPSVNLTGNSLGYGSVFQSPYDGPTYVNAPVYSTSLLYDNQPAAYYTNTITNPNLKPSFSSAWETGLEAKFFENRLGLDLTYFESLDGPGIYNLPISEGSGYTNAIINGIKTLRKGWEVVLDGSPIDNPDGLTWDIMVNWSAYREYINEIDGTAQNLDAFRQVGERIDQFWGTALVKTAEGQIVNTADGRPIPLTSLNGNARRFLGYANPDWVWGINNRFSIKQWSFSFQFDGRVGGVIADYVQQQTFRGGRHIETIQGKMGEARYQDYLGVKSWVGPGVVVTSGTPVIDREGNITNMNELTFANNTTPTFLQDWISRYYNTNEGNLMSRSFAKLREVIISYNLPHNILERTFIKRASVSLIGRNLLYFAEKTDIDIEQYASYGETRSGLQTPTLRRYGVNLNITF